VSEFVRGARQAEGVERGRERSGCRGPRVAHAHASRPRWPRAAGRSRYRSRARWPICAGPEGRSPMWASRVSMAHRWSSKASRVKIYASEARLSTSAPSRAAAASHASPRAQPRPTSSIPVRPRWSCRSHQARWRPPGANVRGWHRHALPSPTSPAEFGDTH
jgi:hypothetical protein